MKIWNPLIKLIQLLVKLVIAERKPKVLRFLNHQFLVLFVFHLFLFLRCRSFELPFEFDHFLFLKFDKVLIEHRLDVEADLIQLRGVNSCVCYHFIKGIDCPQKVKSVWLDRIEHLVAKTFFFIELLPATLHFDLLACELFNEDIVSIECSYVLLG